MAGWSEADIPDQKGRVAVVTGANSGIGFDTARALAQKGARVILGCRDAEKGRDAERRIRSAVQGAQLLFLPLDLASLASVAGFAKTVEATEPKVDLLVNNAGVMMPPRSLSPQGHETQFASNHLGHFALTGLLLDRITDRVVTVSSDLHRSGHIHFDDLTGALQYSPTRFYSQSKFANVLFGLELHRRLRR